MDIYIGRGGNQAADLTTAGVAPLHCIINEEDDDYKVTPMNVLPTLADGERIGHEAWVSADTMLTVGNITLPITELAKTADLTEWSDWGVARRRLCDFNAAFIFNKGTVGEYYIDEEESGGTEYILLWGYSACCMAYYMIEQGQMRKAQELIYEAGDDLYALQDGSPRFKIAYAGVLALLAWFYVKIDRLDVAREALNGAKQIIGPGIKVSPEITDIINKTANSL